MNQPRHRWHGWLAGMALALLPALSMAASGPFVVQLYHQPPEGERTPMADVLVRLSGRHSYSDAQGDARFEALAAGAYQLTLAHPGYQRIHQSLELGGEQRQPLQLQLLPAPQVSWRGDLLAAGVGLPVVGARVDLSPLEVSAAIAGPARGLSDWEGRFEFVALPVGRYTMRIQAAGFEPLEQTVTVPDQADEAQPPRFTLQAASSPATVSVRLVDGLSGQPLANALVRLAETEPHGLIAEGRSDANGELVFEGLRSGAANWIDDSGRLAIVRPDLTLHGEHEGYQSLTRTIRISGDTQPSLELALLPLTVQTEQEPNDTLQQAQEIRTAAPVRLRIQQQGDHDYFRFRLQQPALLSLRLEPAPLETHLRLLDANGDLVQEQGIHANRENRFERKLAAGTWYVQVGEWGDNHHDEEHELTLWVERTSAADPLEPNDTADQASPVSFPNHISGRIWPQGDRDRFRFEVHRPGVVRIDEPGADWERHLRLLNAKDELLAEVGVHSNNPLRLERALTPGSYQLELLEWGNNHASLTPYRLALQWLEDDGVDDPAEAQRALRQLPLNSYSGSTLLPQGDVDRYHIRIPGAGVLTLRSHGLLERHLQLFDQEGRLLSEQGVHAQRTASISHHFAGPSQVFAAIREWGDNHWSPSAYHLSAEFQPADELDAVRRNDDFDRATPILPGDVIRGNYLPLGDRDMFVLETDFPGYLRVRASSPLETHLRIYNAQRQLVAEQGVHAGQSAQLRPEVGAGSWYILVGEWGDNQSSPAPYELVAQLERAEPQEQEPLRDDPPRMLRDGEAQAFAFDQRGDRDRWFYESAAAGPLRLRLFHPLEVLVRVYDDRSGERLHESGHHAQRPVAIDLNLSGPTRLRIELSEWGDNNASLEPGFILIDSEGRELVAAPVVVEPDPAAPRRLLFRLAPLAGLTAPRECRIDLEGDGTPELRLTDDQPQALTPPQPGLYRALALCSGGAGQSSRQSLWAEVREERARSGVALSLVNLAEGQLVEQAQPIQAQAVSYDGMAIASVQFTLNGQPLTRDFDPPYLVEPPWASLAPGEQRLLVSARDTAGAEASLERRFTLSEYFALQPADGAVVSGEELRVSWQAAQFGPALLRYRVKGEESWQEVEGESGYQRRVSLRGLEPQLTYEIQPLGGSQPGPIRSLTRVKGLAFGSPRYGANIRRDYDQRLAISVRNNSDEALRVRLESTQPADPLLYVGFVGDGSADRPFELTPGEERRFMLGISAQDVATADHRFSVRILAEEGLSDEAEVVVHVQLPKIELAWEDLGEIAGTRGHRYRLRNLGDTITDLEVTAAEPDQVEINPAMQHGLLAAGHSLEFTVSPRFYQGFKGLSTRLVAKALDKRFEQPFEVRLAPGEEARRVWLLPGMDLTASQPSADEQQLTQRAERAQQLDPASIDWSRRTQGSDRSGDGRPDRWSQRLGDTLWLGDDTTGDGEVDFVHADIGEDGIFEYSALLEDGQWRATNLVEAWLEMGFSLPWSRDSYNRHDADITLNGEVIGRLRDTIPEGNYRFPIPPRLLRFDPSGKPGENRVGIRSEHLRGGHYVVNSDFRFKFRLTTTPVWTLAVSEPQARAFAASAAGLSLAAPDLSLSSAQIRLQGPAEPQAGDELTLEIPLRNLGAVSPHQVEVALLRGDQRDELARVTLENPALLGDTLVRIPFKAPGGQNRLYVVADPDNTSGDSDRSNNEAVFFLQAAGDDQAPSLRLIAPLDGAQLTHPLVLMRFEVHDDQGAVTPALAVNGGLWHSLPATQGEVTAELLLQPGSHQIELRAQDSSGNRSETRLQLQVTSATPEARIIAPAEGAVLHQRQVEVVVESAADSALIAARSAGGPWHKAALVGNQGKVSLPLRFGDQTIEVMLADKTGAVTRLERQVHCSQQPSADDSLSGPAAADQGLLWPADRPDLEIDLFQYQSGPLTKLQLPPADQAQRLRDDARRRQAQGDYAGALNKYRESLLLQADPAVGERVKKLEIYLQLENK